MPLLLNIEFIELNQIYRGSIEIGIQIVGLCRLVVKSIGIVSVGVADVVGSSSMIIIGPCGGQGQGSRSGHIGHRGGFGAQSTLYTNIYN